MFDVVRKGIYLLEKEEQLPEMNGTGYLLRHNKTKARVVVVVSEDSICHLAAPQKVKVLDQWTFHARLYRAAAYAAEHEDTELVQLVSFGCGVDAITTDEVCRILEQKGKYYTQIKIDEITNLGAVRIRLRSLLGALEERR